MIRKAAIVMLLLCAGSVQAQSPEEPDVRRAVNDFVRAFVNLDWERFRASFDSNATVFFPRAGRRAEEKQSIEAGFQQVFAKAREARKSAPYLTIEPHDMKVQAFGDTAIVTFHLDDDPAKIQRRTVVLHKTKVGWKIVHIHASEVAAQQDGGLQSGEKHPMKNENPK